MISLGLGMALGNSGPVLAGDAYLLPPSRASKGMISESVEVEGDPKVAPGAGSQEFVVGALEMAQLNWSKSACLSGVEARADQPVYELAGADRVPGDPGAPVMRRDSFRFLFYDAAKAPRAYEVAVTRNRGPKARNRRRKGGGTVYAVSDTRGADPWCVSEMGLESAEALAAAVKAGVAAGRKGYSLSLRAVKDKRSRFWAAWPAARGRTVWVVGPEGGPGGPVVLDAGDGEVLARP